MNHVSHFHFCPYDGGPLSAEDPQGLGRGRCQRCGFVDYQNPRPCVAFLVLRDRCVLLARRAVEPAKGIWDIPGGFIDVTDESVEAAVVREAFEETSLRVRVSDYLGSLRDVYTYGGRTVPTLNLCFLVEEVSGVVCAQSDVAELEWVHLERLPADMAFTHQHIMLQWLRKRVQGGQQSAKVTDNEGGLASRSGPKP